MLRDEIVEEQRVWAERNFPDQKPHQPVLGLVEELGELTEAYLVGDQPKVIDGLGDFWVYAINACRHFDANFHYLRAAGHAREQDGALIFNFRSADQMLLKAMALIGRLCHGALKMEQGIRGTKEEHLETISNALADLWIVLSAFASYFDLSLKGVLENTWNEVMQRDWLKNPETGTA